MPQPWTIYRTGTERCTITEAHPYHGPPATNAGKFTVSAPFDTL